MRDLQISARENMLRAWRFERPAWIPMAVNLYPLRMAGYAQGALEEIMREHPAIFPHYTPGMYDADKMHVPPDMFPERPYRDGWGCLWKTNYLGMVGAVVEHPLADLGSIKQFTPPDPEVHNGMYPLDWAAERVRAEQCRAEGWLHAVGLPHGHTLLRMQDLVGYERLMMAFMLEEPEAWDLIAMVERFNTGLLERYVELRPEVVHLPEDLGMQTSPLISPDMFRRFICPSYTRLTQIAKRYGAVIHQHSDGHVLDLIDDLIGTGAEVINVQDLVNGIDNIAQVIKGRLAIDLDIDRQNVTVTGTPREVKELIREAVFKLGSPVGGLSMVWQPWSPTQLENVRAVVEAMEEHMTHYA